MNSSPTIKPFHFHCMAMATRFDLITYGLSEEDFNKVIIRIEQEIRRIDKKFNRFDPGSELSRINREAHSSTVQTDQETIHLIDRCCTWRPLTSGLFDITVGIFTSQLNPRHVDPSLPAHTEYMTVDLGRQTIRFHHADVAIDLGGIGKGYALERIVQILHESGIVNALLNFGNSSITGLGRHPHGDYWPVSIGNMYQPQEELFTFNLHDSSLSTSGNSLNNRQKYGNSGHIFNPKTKQMVTVNKTISLTSHSPFDAEILSTALLLADDTEKNEILKSFPGIIAFEVRYNDDNQPETEILKCH